MTQQLGEWVTGRAGGDLSELTASRVSEAAFNRSSQKTESSQSQGFLVSFMSATLEACANLIGSSIAGRVFQQRFPRLSYRTVIRENWKDGEDVVLLALVSLTR